MDFKQYGSHQVDLKNKPIISKLSIQSQLSSGNQAENTWANAR